MKKLKFLFLGVFLLSMGILVSPVSADHSWALPCGTNENMGLYSFGTMGTGALVHHWRWFPPLEERSAGAVCNDPIGCLWAASSGKPSNPQAIMLDAWIVTDTGHTAQKFCVDPPPTDEAHVWIIPRSRVNDSLPPTDEAHEAHVRIIPRSRVNDIEFNNLLPTLLGLID